LQKKNRSENLILLEIGAKLSAVSFLDYNFFKTPQQERTRDQFCLSPAFPLVSCSGYFPTLKMEAIRPCETSVDFQRTMWWYISEDGIIL
jgi:hypothetical protein